MSLQIKAQTGLAALYSSAQAYHMQAPERSKLLGIRAIIPNHTVRTDNTSAEMKEVLKSMDFGVETDPTARPMRLSFPGQPFLCHPFNFNLFKILDEKPTTSFDVLPPSTEIIIKLMRTHPHHKYIERPADDDDKYFSHEALPNALDEYFIEIEDISIDCEVMTLVPEAMAKLSKKMEDRILKYRFHTPDIGVQRIAAGQQELNVTFPVLKGTRIMYFGFAYQSQIYFSTDQKKFCSTRAIWPSSCERAQFFLDDEEILTSGGLTKLGGSDDDANLSGLQYIQYLEHLNLLDAENPNIFTRGSENSYRHYIVVDLTPFRGDVARDFHAHLTFTGGGSPQDLMCFLCRVTETELRREVISGQKKWSIVHNPK